MRHKWTIAELKEKSDGEVLRGILAERMSKMNPHCSLYRRLKEIVNGMDENATNSRKRDTTPSTVIPRVIIRIQGGNFQGASANTFVDLSILDIDNMNACDPVGNKNELDYYLELEQEVETLKPIR
jgi:hypothetical protein